MIQLGLLSFSDGRESVHQDLAPDIQIHASKIKRLLEETGEINVIEADEIVHSHITSREMARKLNAHKLDGVIFHVSVFAFPNYLLIAAQLIQKPCLLLTPHDPRYPGLTGLLAAGGAFHQIDFQHERVWVDLDEHDAVKDILTFARAAATKTRLVGQVYGLIGGRSIGMATGASPAELWQKQFGVDIDHVDQSEILRLANVIPQDKVETAKAWLNQYVRKVEFDGEQFTPEKWDFQLRCYLAIKEVIDHYQFDFAGIKCHYDMSAFYSVQCISAAFLNDPYDWDGPKEPVPLACEADSDGALTMQMLHLISNKPACLLDLRFYDKNKEAYVMPNCGAAPTWFANRSDDPAENLKHVDLVPSISKYAGGGAHVRFVFKPGDLTLARLTRSSSGYQMVIAKAETVNYKIPDVVGASPNWPHAFVKLKVQPTDLVRTLQANHLHAVAGDYVDELLSLCRLMDIKPVVLGISTDQEIGDW